MYNPKSCRTLFDPCRVTFYVYCNLCFNQSDASWYSCIHGEKNIGQSMNDAWEIFFFHNIFRLGERLFFFFFFFLFLFPKSTIREPRKLPPQSPSKTWVSVPSSAQWGVPLQMNQRNWNLAKKQMANLFSLCGDLFLRQCATGLVLLPRLQSKQKQKTEVRRERV